MAWWRTFYEQAGEAWQQLLYSLELACSGADDLPWLDTLNFMWDSLPDADKLTTAERRRLAHSSKQRVRDSVSQHYAHELSHKAAIHKRQTAAAAAAAKLAEQHLQKLADARQRKMEELCTQSRQQSMRLPSIAELEQIAGQWLLPQQGGGQPWPLLQQQQQRASSGQFGPKWQQQQQQQLDRRGSGMTRVAGQRALRGSLRSGSIAGSSKLERVLSGDEVAEVVDAAAAAVAEELVPCNGDVVIHIPDASSNSSGSEIEPLAMQQQQQRVLQLRCIVTGVSSSSTSELQQPLLPPVVESPFAAPQQQRQQQLGFWGLDDIPEQQQQEQLQDSQYEPPSVLVLAAAKLQQQLEQQQQQQASDVASITTSSSSGSGIWTFNFSQNRAAAAAAGSAQLPTPGYASQQLQDHAVHAPAGAEDCLQHSASQMLLQRYLNTSPPAAHTDAGAAAAAAAAVVIADSAPVQLCAAGDTHGQQQQQCCDLTLVESEPSSECATATSSTADHYSSCCGGCQSDSVCQTDSVCDVVQSPVAVPTRQGAAKPAAAAAAPADVAAQCDMFV